VNTEKFECVFVKSGEEAKLRVITTGIQDDSNIEILTGLAVGDLIITGPYNTVTKTLNNGDKVEEKSPEEDKKDD
jgi:HlyD family secretion protein